ncbi:S-layer protein [Methanocaldococcus villosus KIN24-T80]|uniref:S-layer protein n=1 Tax=Methanocaldococcus villosus KIN24-T80 TaxID=1069083 RepID=N6VQF7_9EURY|nr:S-layer protein [Methanocaldococcus villosus]ENN96105.1 S-layer protein [Methanocaldococcus villosus KIN24-T80]
MAISLKKIGAIAVAGAMLGTAVASGVAAQVTIIGDLTKDLFVKDGQPNCYVVVGANAPSTMDVVSAADIAAKIGSLCYKEANVEDGSAEIEVSAKADSDDVDIYTNGIPNGNATIFVAAADSDYSDNFATTTANINDTNSNVFDDTQVKNVKSLGDVATLMKIDDVDPSDWYNSDDDAAEVVFVKLENNSGSLTVDKKDAVYASIVYKDDLSTFKDTTTLKVGYRIPFLGEEYAVVKIDNDNDAIYIGKPVYDGVLKEGETYDLGNGYEVKVKAILTDNTNYKADVQILKDGKVVAEKFDTTPLKIIYNDIGVVVNKAWQDIPGNYGFAEVLITNNVKELDLGKEYVKDWKLYAVVNNSGTMELTDQLPPSSGNVVGIALRYEGDKLDDLDSGDSIAFPNNYVEFKLDDKDKKNKLYVYYEMDESKDTTLNIGEKTKVLNADIKLKGIKAEAQQVVPVTAPIAKLDTEVSLDNADRNLVLVGGPVANKLTKELVDEGKINLDNTSPATIAVIKGAANGHDVVVVAGGDREKTREAAEELLKKL